MIDHLAEYRRKIAAGEIDPPERTGPKVTQAQWRAKVKRFCLECMGNDEGARTDVANCTSPACTWFDVRPFQGMRKADD